jgi:hypothetical protein
MIDHRQKRTSWKKTLGRRLTEVVERDRSSPYPSYVVAKSWRTQRASLLRVTRRRPTRIEPNRMKSNKNSRLLSFFPFLHLLTRIAPPRRDETLSFACRPRSSHLRYFGQWRSDRVRAVSVGLCCGRRSVLLRCRCYVRLFLQNSSERAHRMARLR